MASRRSSKWVAQQSRRQLLSGCPRCIFCGGVNSANTVEHCPPRHFFEARKFPQGFIFACCKKCNNSTSDHDQIFAVFAGLRMSPSSWEWRQKVQKLRRHLGGSTWSELSEEMSISRIDEYFMAMREGKSSIEELVGSLKVVRLPRIVEESFRAVGAKLYKGVYYNENGRIFPQGGKMWVQIVPNYSMLFDPSCRLQEVVRRIPGLVIPVVAQSRDLSDQFKIRVAMAEDASIGHVVAFFCESVALSIWGFADPSLASQCGFSDQDPDLCA